MARRTVGFKATHEPVTGARGKKTSVGDKNIGFAHMNKHKRRSYKKYRGQGR